MTKGQIQSSGQRQAVLAIATLCSLAAVVHYLPWQRPPSIDMHWNNGGDNMPIEQVPSLPLVPPNSNSSTVEVLRRSRRLNKKKTSDQGKMADPKSVEFKPQVQMAQTKQSSSTSSRMHEERPFSNHPRKIVCCAMWEKAVHVIFPKWDKNPYRYIYLHHGERRDIHELIREYELTDQDLYFGHIYSGDSCVSGGVFNFPGKQLYFNPEPKDEWVSTPRPPDELEFSPMKNKQRVYNYVPPNPNIVVAGPHVDTQNSVQVFAGVQYFTLTGRTNKLQELYDPTLHRLRPVNTREYFMAYVQSHYVPERERAVELLANTFFDPKRPEQTRIHVAGKCHASREQSLVGKKCIPLQTTVDHAGEDLTSKAMKRQRFQAGSAMKKTSQSSEHMKELLNKLHVLNNTQSNFMENNKLLHHYRFTLTFENIYRDGYISEKIFNTFLSGSVPVYWGTRDVFNIFNRRAFVFYDMEHPEEALEKIAFLEANPKAYDRMLREPILAHGLDTVRRYLSLSDDIGEGYLRRQIMEKLGYDLNKV